MKEIPVYFKGKFYRFAKVDDEDYLRCVKTQWRAAITKEGKTSAYPRFYKVFLHEYVLKITHDPKYVVDHINGDTFDCQKRNLRIITALQNSWNRERNYNKKSSKYKGVFRYVTEKDKTPHWIAGIRVDTKLIKEHGFLTEEDAAHAYDNLARIHFGEFARLNFPDINKVPEKRQTKTGEKWIVTRTIGKRVEYWVQISKKHTDTGKKYVKYFNNLPDAIAHRDEKILEYGMSDGLLL